MIAAAAAAAAPLHQINSTQSFENFFLECAAGGSAALSDTYSFGSATCAVDRAGSPL